MRSRRLLVTLIGLSVLVLGAYVATRLVLGSDLVRSAIEQQLATRLAQPVRIGSATASILPRVALDLHDVAIGAPAAVQLGRVSIVTGLRPLLSRIVHEAEIVIADGRVELPLPFALPSPASSTTSVPASPALTVTSIRRIELRAVAFAAGKQTFVVDADSAVDGDHLDIRRLSARARTSRIEAHGALTSIAKLEGHLEANGDPLDLDELITFDSALTATTGNTSAGSRAPSPAMPMRLSVTLAAPTGRFATYSFRDLSSTIDIAPGRFTLAPLRVRAFGGGFQGRLDADTRRSVADLRLTGRVEGLDVAELMKAAGSPGGITGRFAGNLSLAGMGTDSETLMRTARGTIAAALTDGTMPHLDIVRTIVLTFGKPSGAPAEGSGSAFSHLGGAFAIANSTLTSDNISMHARDFDMAGRGTLQILTGALAARVDVVLSDELTAQAGTDLRRYAQQDGRVILPATISGTLQRPTISIDLAAATRRALGNELQRRAKSFLDGLFRKKK
jgi:uncharacterized protein involved in outer membrane biogenesis